MDRSFGELAEVQARFYYLDLVAWLRDLHAAHDALVQAMTSVLEEYDQVAPRCKLRLYPRKRRGSFGPTALYWGNLFRLHPSSTGTKQKLKNKAVHHLKGRFDPRWVYRFAKRFDLKDRFLDFDRRRLALNAACRAIYRALREVRKATVVQVPPDSSPLLVPSGLDPGSKRQVPELPDELLPRDLPPDLRIVLRSGWVVAFSLALAEEEFSELGKEVDGNPSLDGLRLALGERTEGHFYPRATWVDGAAQKTYPKMTDRLMRELRVRQGARPVLALKELKRRRIARLQGAAAQALGSVRDSCSRAQLDVAKGLARARAILLPQISGQGAARLPAAS
jgi:hypothetical protein